MASLCLSRLFGATEGNSRNGFSWDGHSCPVQFCASALGAQGWEMDYREVLLSGEVHFFLEKGSCTCSAGAALRSMSSNNAAAFCRRKAQAWL